MKKKTQNAKFSTDLELIEFELVQKILVLRIDSADAEGGFSISNHVESARRINLTKQHMTDFLTNCINTNDDLAVFGQDTLNAYR